MHTLSGIGAAVPTIVNDHNTIDTDAQRRLAHHLRHQGAKLILVAGTTGRGTTLNGWQRAELVDSCAGVLPVICGIPPRAINEIPLLHGCGATGALIGFSEGTPLADVISAHDVCQNAGVTMIAYQHTAHNVFVPSNWWPTLIDNGILIKNSDSDMGNLTAMCASGAGVFVGATTHLADVRRIGAIGALNGAASIMFPDALGAINGDIDAIDRLTAWELDAKDGRIRAIEQAAWDLVH